MTMCLQTVAVACVRKVECSGAYPIHSTPGRIARGPTTEERPTLRGPLRPACDVVRCACARYTPGSASGMIVRSRARELGDRTRTTFDDGRSGVILLLLLRVLILRPEWRATDNSDVYVCTELLTSAVSRHARLPVR